MKWIQPPSSPRKPLSRNVWQCLPAGSQGPFCAKPRHLQRPLFAERFWARLQQYPACSSGISAFSKAALGSRHFVFLVSSLFSFTKFKSPSMSRGGTRVYFGKIPRDTRERDLERFVRGFGRVREVSIKAGYGFVVSAEIQAIEHL